MSPNEEARPWRDVKLPDSAAKVPAMLTADERKYYFWLAAEAYEGWGALLDLGCWLGGSSAAFAAGLEAGGKKGVVEARDLFSWEPGYMESGYGADLEQGADFMPLFEELTAPYASRIHVEKLDLRQARWSGGPIEILFVDAAKSWNLMNAIFEGFGGAVVPGRTRIVHQDFRHFTTTWLPLVTDSRPDLFEESEATSEGGTVAFWIKAALEGDGGLELPYGPGSFPYEKAAPILRRRIESANDATRILYQLGLCAHAMAAGREDEAGEIVELARAHFGDDYPRIERMLNGAARQLRA